MHSLSTPLDVEKNAKYFEKLPKVWASPNQAMSWFPQKSKKIKRLMQVHTNRHAFYSEKALNSLVAITHSPFFVLRDQSIPDSLIDLLAAHRENKSTMASSTVSRTETRKKKES